MQVIVFSFQHVGSLISIVDRRKHDSRTAKFFNLKLEGLF